MSKVLYIAEKPSVAKEFARVLKLNTRSQDGFLESEDSVFTWCVGHLVTMSYPEVYDISYKKWSLATLPFLPDKFLYEVIDSVKKQFEIVKSLLNREDISTIYVCTDSGREGEYIYRLVEQMAEVKGKVQKRVWIDSQTEDEILRGIREAKELSEYDNLAASAYLRAKEDYLMGINFSRLLTLQYGNSIANFLKKKYVVLSVGRVMTCVLGMVVRREREIREFVKTPFYRVLGNFLSEGLEIEGEWRAVEGSSYFQSPYLYKENGFKEREKAESLLKELGEVTPYEAVVSQIEKKKELKNPPLLYNLAELQNECSKRFKISPDETLKIVQELYEKKMVTYPRTDARVLSSAIAKEIDKNIRGFIGNGTYSEFASEILEGKKYTGLEKTRYVNDKQITDHYAIIPTGQNMNQVTRLHAQAGKVFDLIVKRFLSIFYPPAQYQKINLVISVGIEKFFSTEKVLIEEGYLKIAEFSRQAETSSLSTKEEEDLEENEVADTGKKNLSEAIKSLKKGSVIQIGEVKIKEGETTPPKRYHSGSLILAMENAGQFIESEELREQIKGSGIGTSATRAEILKKLVHIKYLGLNSKNQIITPTLLGELIFEAVDASIRSLLNPELTASWEKGLNYVAEGTITDEEYQKKLNDFIKARTATVLSLRNQGALQQRFQYLLNVYNK